MGAMGSSSEVAPDELTAQFDAQELRELRGAFDRLARPSGGALEPAALDALAPGVPWAALHAAMLTQAAGGTAVRWQHFLAVIASACKGRPSERREFVAGSLYADPPSSGAVTRASLTRLLADAAIAARGGDAGEPPAGIESAAADALLAGSGGSLPVSAWAAWLSSQMPVLPGALEVYLLQYLCALGRLGGEERLPSGGRLELPNGVLSAVQEPLLRPTDGQEEGHELLCPTTAWMLRLAMAGGATTHEAPEWRCLYASRAMGLSMNRFNHHASTLTPQPRTAHDAGPACAPR